MLGPPLVGDRPLDKRPVTRYGWGPQCRLDSLPELLHRLGAHAESAGDTAYGGQLGRHAPRLDEVDAAGRYPGSLGQAADAQQAVCPAGAEGWHGDNHFSSVDAAG